MLNNLIRVCAKFNDQVDSFIHPKPSRSMKMLLFLDMLIAYVIHGAGRTDYVYFEFWRKSHFERRTFLTRRRFKNMLNRYNDRQRSGLFRNKSEFNSIFTNFIKRSWLDVGRCSFEEFHAFVSHHTAVAIKPVKGYEGRGIYRLDLPSNDIDRKKLYEHLLETGAIMEELITPGILSEFNPSSVNSIRIGTLLMDLGPEIKFASMKLGNGDVFVDNYALGGIHAVIDVNTGIVVTRGSDINKNQYIKHPVTGKQILGYQVPDWERIVEAVKNASAVVPEVRYVGWDVTFNGAREVVIIEGNEEACRTFQALDQVGRRHLFS